MSLVTEHFDSHNYDHEASEIGAILASARRSKDISLQDLSDLLRIPKAYIRSLENSDFDSLPGVAYVPGYIRSVCKVLEIDSAPLIQSYLVSVKNEGIGTSYDVPGQALVPRFSKSSIAMMAVLIAIVGYTGWFVIVRDEPEQIASLVPTVQEIKPDIDANEIVQPDAIGKLEDSPVANTPAENEQRSIQPIGNIPALLNENEATSSDLAEVDKNELGDKTTISDSAPPIGEEILTAQNDENLQITEQSGSDNIKAVNAIDSKDTTAGPSSAVAKEIELSDTLTIRATSAAWIEMVDSNGEVVTSKLLRTGDSIATNLKDSLYFTTGNAGGLMFEMMDAPAFKIGKTGEIIRDLPLTSDTIIKRKFD
jgi:cytoskeleton protein RodZ